MLAGAQTYAKVGFVYTAKTSEDVQDFENVILLRWCKLTIFQVVWVE